jgi:gamma-glutamyltranspeptidase/glutathione hydrolase
MERRMLMIAKHIPRIALATWTCLLAGCTTQMPVKPQAVFRGGAVAADHIVASQAGVAILRQGGNAVDAAIATSFTLAVTDPFSCGLGGGGFMMVYKPATTEHAAIEAMVNYREVSPNAVDATFYARQPHDDASRIGGTAVGIPGTVAGLWAAHQQWGELPWRDVMRPAIAAAQDGVSVNAAWSRAAKWLGTARSKDARTAEVSAWIWQNLCNSGDLRSGDVIRQPELARLLRRLAGRGADFFYRGEVARDIVLATQASGGAITVDDIERYSANVGAPLVAHNVFGKYTLLTMPPPSSGGIAEIQVMRIMSQRWPSLADPSPSDPDYLHLLASALQHAFADRAQWLADGTFSPVPVEDLLHADRIAAAAKRIDMNKASPPIHAHVLAPPDDAGTSHLCVVDANGMAVACTETVNYLWGSCVAVPQWGVVLNNEMDDFTTKLGAPNAYGLSQSERNAPEGGKRPLSSMSPTIVLQDGRVRLVAGASGGPRIISATIQAIIDVLQFGLTPTEALAQGRLHQQWKPDVLWLESGRFDALIHEDLRRRGWDVQEREGVGVEQLLEVRPNGTLLPASDPRKGGESAGVERVQ